MKTSAYYKHVSGLATSTSPCLTMRLCACNTCPLSNEWLVTSISQGHLGWRRHGTPRSERSRADSMLSRGFIPYVVRLIILPLLPSGAPVLGQIPHSGTCDATVRAANRLALSNPTIVSLCHIKSVKFPTRDRTRII